MKLTKRQGTSCFLISIVNLFLLLLATQARSNTLLIADFNANTEGFAYSDDTFRGTNNPTYANGNYPAKGYSGTNGLSIILGGVDKQTINSISGGWSRNFTLDTNSSVKITLRYRLLFTKYYEADECGQALVAVDGNLISPIPGQDYLHQFCGATPNLGSNQNSKWKQVSIDVNLSAGTHTITIGGWNNKKDAKNEKTTIFFDNIQIEQSTSTPTPTPTPDPTVYFSDNFNDGNANGWTVVDETTAASSWQVNGGKYSQSNSVGNYVQSFNKGTYSYYSNGSSLTNYEVTVDITPIGDGSHGILFRYQNNNNYYRFLINRTQGFSRLEKKVSGKFQPIAVNARGPALNQVHTVTVDVEGSKIQVYLDDEPLFSALDTSISSGTVGLFTESNVNFDNVVIQTNATTPKVVITNPTSYFVNMGSTVTVSAVARNVPSGGGVKFTLDGGASSFTDFTEPYSGTFSGVSKGDHTVKAIIVDSSGNTLSNSTNLDEDTNVVIGAQGYYLIGMGDSITEGVDDDFSADDESTDGRNISRGYTPILSDLLSAQLNKPVIIANEGLGGTLSGTKGGNGVSRVDSTNKRHPEAKLWLILFGTNDSGGSMPVPSGKDCTEAQLQAGNASCTGTYKDSMRKIIIEIKSYGDSPLLAKVPYTFKVPPGSSRDNLIKDYNIVIDQLVAEHNIQVTPPDFYDYFKNHHEEFDSDDLHPNGNGYISMANLWFDALISSGIFDP